MGADKPENDIIHHDKYDVADSPDQPPAVRIHNKLTDLIAWRVPAKTIAETLPDIPEIVDRIPDNGPPGRADGKAPLDRFHFLGTEFFGSR